MVPSLFNFISPIVASGLFETLRNGSNNLKNNWDTVAMFSGAIVIIGAIIFTVIAVLKSRDKARWWFSAAVAWIVGAILLISGSVNMVQGNFSDTWSEVFGAIMPLFTMF